MLRSIQFFIFKGDVVIKNLNMRRVGGGAGGGVMKPYNYRRRNILT